MKKSNKINDVAKSHQLRIARATMRLHCIGARLMGAMNHAQAADLLGIPLPKDCDCQQTIKG